MDDGLHYEEDEFDEYDDEDANRDFEAQLNDCGWDTDFAGKCWDVGTEHCSFHCPLHAWVFGGNDSDIPF